MGGVQSLQNNGAYTARGAANAKNLEVTLIDPEKQLRAEKKPTNFPDEKKRLKMSALNYVELSLADPNYGDARRDELALAALAASIGRANRSK